MDGLCLKTGIHSIPPPISVSASLETRTNPTQISALGRSSEKTSSSSSSSSMFSFRYPLRSFWFGRGGNRDNHKNNNSNNNKYKGIALDEGVLVENGGGNNYNNSEEQNGNWVLKILHVRSLWKEDEDFKVVAEDGMDNDGGVVRSSQNSKEEEEKDAAAARDDGGACGGCHGDDECDACSVIDDDDEKEAEFDRDSFSKLLKKVPLAQARLYHQMSYLANLAYSVSELKPSTNFKCRSLQYVTSSIEKRELRTKSEKNEVSMEVQEEDKVPQETNKGPEQKGEGYRLSTSTAYQIAASAASYLHSQARSIIPFNSSNSSTNTDSFEGDNEQSDSVDIMNSDMASLMATTDSVTAVVAAKEEVKQAVADDLRSVSSSPCEWFICDDDESHTRLFVVQGSESLASWQANLLFEPINFEGFDVHVHRGIYEAAKGIYEQMLPEVHAHLKSHGNRATLRFTGHSLGGSLSLLVNLMLLIRGEAPPASLLPVITFGAPSVMCGGDRLLRKLGLPKSHIQSITMHRDIVPRAFSCHYPNHVAKILKAVNGKFRSHSCLNNENLLFAPMGDILILQPDEEVSPHHHLLPSGSGLYVLSCELEDVADAEKHLQAAQKVFMNSPHPLEILSDSSAYGSGGTIQRDHDINSYLKSVRAVISQDLKRMRKARRNWRSKFLWPLVAPRGISTGIVLSRPLTSNHLGQDQFVFSGILQTGRESLKRFSRLVTSQHMHLLVIFLFPARLLLLGAYAVINK